MIEEYIDLERIRYGNALEMHIDLPEHTEGLYIAPLMLLPFKLYAGGPLGSGRQAFPWIHLDDVVGLYFWALTQERLRGRAAWP